MMLYLDDFIEAIENFPEELRDMLTSIRELDLVVQNAVDEQNLRVGIFFQNARKMKLEKRNSVFQSIMIDFKKILDDADEKLNVAERLHNLLLKRVEQLDGEIAKFKIDLEADSPGITAVIDKRVLIVDPVSKERSLNNKKKSKSKKSEKKTSAKQSTVPIADIISTQDLQPICLPLTLASLQLDSNSSSGTETTTTASDANMVYDPTRYCICNQVSYGDMIACDNEMCSYEWFHYACVNLVTAPEGKWYCPKCTLCTVSLERN